MALESNLTFIVTLQQSPVMWMLSHMVYYHSPTYANILLFMFCPYKMIALGFSKLYFNVRIPRAVKLNMSNIRPKWQVMAWSGFLLYMAHASGFEICCFLLVGLHITLVINPKRSNMHYLLNSWWQPLMDSTVIATKYDWLQFRKVVEFFWKTA